MIDLPAHLPYIDDKNWFWYHDTKPINYTNPLDLRHIDGNYESKRYLFEPAGEGLELPDHVFSLTNGKLCGNWLLLDIQAGTITQLSVLNSPQPQVSDEQKGPIWHLYPTKPIPEFFAACQDKMSEHHWNHLGFISKSKPGIRGVGGRQALSVTAGKILVIKWQKQIRVDSYIALHGLYRPKTRMKVC